MTSRHRVVVKIPFPWSACPPRTQTRPIRRAHDAARQRLGLRRPSAALVGANAHPTPAPTGESPACVPSQPQRRHQFRAFVIRHSFGFRHSSFVIAPPVPPQRRRREIFVASRPKKPSLIPNGGEGARRADEGARVGWAFHTETAPRRTRVAPCSSTIWPPARPACQCLFLSHRDTRK